MFSYIFVAVLLLKTVSSQINGEFWWLHEKVAKLQQVEPPPPKFDDVNEFDTDDSARIIFNDNDIYSHGQMNKNISEVEWNQGKVLSNVIYFHDQTELAKPATLLNSTFIKKNTNSLLINTSNDKSIKEKEPNILSNKTANVGDEFEFKFPKNSDLFWDEDVMINNTKNVVFNVSKSYDRKTIYKPNTIRLNDKVWFEEGKNKFESESICTFIPKEECISKNGIVNMPESCPRNVIFQTQKICCVLPLSTKAMSKNGIPNTNYKLIKRYKRSEPVDKLNSVLKQRNALLLRNHSQTQTNRPAQKIVTPDYVDPYWNIKNSKFRNPSTQSSTYQDYQSPDYVDDYTVELPRPGLVGIYSDNGKLQGETSWKVKNIRKGFTYYDNTEEVSDEDSDDGSDTPSGYSFSTFDPRLGMSTNKPARPLRRKSNRVTTPKNMMQQTESHTINFHSTPDFHVLQGFKLINLVGNKNRFARKTTTERFENVESLQQSDPPIYSDDEYIDTIDLDQQVYKQCGRNVKNTLSPIDSETAGNGCDPWLSIVVATKHPESILCYATIVHPRAAVTAADCVHRKAIGDVTLISGVWDLKEDRENAQQRMSTIHIHKQFNSEDLANNLAILHWKRPLRIDAQVQPACIGDPHIGDSCYFVGWGGYDRALQPRPHWQHATILTPRDCSDKISSPDINVPAGGFCASVKTRGTVTGVGGPLLCKSGGRISIVGVAVYRESVVVLLPTFEWIISALQELQIY